MGFPDAQLDALSFDLTKRPEQLSLEEFLELTRLLHPFRDLVGRGAFTLPGAGSKRID